MGLEPGPGPMAAVVPAEAPEVEPVARAVRDPAVTEAAPAERAAAEVRAAGTDPAEELEAGPEEIPAPAVQEEFPAEAAVAARPIRIITWAGPAETRHLPARGKSGRHLLKTAGNSILPSKRIPGRKTNIRLIWNSPAPEDG